MGQNGKPHQIPLVLIFAGLLSLTKPLECKAFYTNAPGLISLALKFSYLESNRFYDNAGNLHHSPYFHFSQLITELKVEFAPSRFVSFYLSLPVVHRSGSLYQNVTFFYPDTGLFLPQAIPLSVSGSGIGDSTLGLKFYLDEYMKLLNLPFELKLRFFIEATVPTGDSEGDINNNFMLKLSRLPTGTGQTDFTAGMEVLLTHKWIEGFISTSYTYRDASHALKGWIAFAIPNAIKPGNILNLRSEVRLYPARAYKSVKFRNLYLTLGADFRFVRPYAFKVIIVDLLSMYYSGKEKELPFTTRPAFLSTVYFRVGHQQSNGFFWSLSFHFPVGGKNYPEDPDYTTPKDPYYVGSIKDVEGLFLLNRFPEVPGFYSLVELGYAWK